MRQDKKWPKQRNFTKFKAESSADWGVMPGDWQALVEPQVRQFLDYWESRRRGRSRMPGRPNLDPADIPGLLPGVFLVDVLVSGSGLRFRYRLLGTEHTEIYGADLTGSYVDEALHPPWRDAVLDSYSKAAHTGEPDEYRAQEPRAPFYTGNAMKEGSPAGTGNSGDAKNHRHQH